MSDEEESVKEMPVEILFVGQEELPSPEDPPMSEWSSLEISIPEENKKKLLYSEGLYSPGSGEICTKYIMASDSSIFDHPYYNYPAVTDPGINEALTVPEETVIFPDDGQALYLSLCKEMHVCPVRMFYRNLLTPEMNISYYGVNCQGVRAMARALQYNKFVTRLDLTGNFLNEDACFHLGRMLSSNVKLTELIVHSCHLGPSGILRLGDTLPINRTLVYLDISSNLLGETGGMYFAKQLYDGATIKRVNLSNNQLGPKTAIALADVWDWKNRFTHLDLSWNQFYHVPSCTKMLNNLALSVDLEELNLSFNSLEGEQIASAIAKVLLIPTLTVLDLSHNHFQNEAIDIIIANLFKAKRLHTFNISFNPMTPQDAYKVLQKMIRVRIKIKYLLMENVCVNKLFIDLLEKIKKMKNRKDFVCTFDKVLQNWSVQDPDARILLLKRAQFLGKTAKRHKVDTALYFLTLDKEYPKPLPTKDMLDRVTADHVPLTASLIKELSWAFPGPANRKTRTVNFKLMTDFINRIWPDKKLPPTPPPAPVQEPENEPEPPPKGKKKGTGKK